MYIVTHTHSGTRAAHSAPRGFSLIELLVVFAIVAIISTLILARYGQFNGQVLLRNLAYDIALSVRQAQVYSLSGRTNSTASGVSYGVYFPATPNTQYYLFTDTDRNGAYSGASEISEALTIRPGYSIIDMCGDRISGTSDCVSSAGANKISFLTLVFKWPEPDAYIKTNVGTSGYKTARIIVRSPTGDTRTVSVSLTGQISVQQEIN